MRNNPNKVLRVSGATATVNARDYTMVLADATSGAIALTLITPGIYSEWSIKVANVGSGSDVTLSVAGGGSFSFTLPAGAACEIAQDDLGALRVFGSTGASIGDITNSASVGAMPLTADGDGNLSASRITDDSTDINVTNTTGETRIGDWGYDVNGTNIVVDDPGKSVYIAANDNNADNAFLQLRAANDGEALLQAANGFIRLRESTGQLYLSPFKTIVANAPVVLVDGVPSMDVFQPSIGNPTVTVIGATGAASYGYRIVATGVSGTHTAASTETSIANGNATLDGTNFNRITWALVAGATQYDIYRTTGGATQGYIGSASLAEFDDTGLAGDSAVPPATNTFGQLAVSGNVGFYGTAPVARPNVPLVATPQAITDALVLLGLVTQS